MEHVNQDATRPATTRGRYVGPTAARIAELLASHQRIRFERGWFHTEALCHRSEQDQLSFRQRPDGDGIDVRCTSAGCSRERAIRRLESLTGEPIWSAYSPEPRTPAAPTDDSTSPRRGRNWRVALIPMIVILLAAPLVLGYDLQVVALNGLGLAWAGWLVRRLLLGRRHSVARAGRQR